MTAANEGLIIFTFTSSELTLSCSSPFLSLLSVPFTSSVLPFLSPLLFSFYSLPACRFLSCPFPSFPILTFTPPLSASILIIVLSFFFTSSHPLISFPPSVIFHPIHLFPTSPFCLRYLPLFLSLCLRPCSLLPHSSPPFLPHRLPLSAPPQHFPFVCPYILSSSCLSSVVWNSSVLALKLAAAPR